MLRYERGSVHWGVLNIWCGPQRWLYHRRPSGQNSLGIPHVKRVILQHSTPGYLLQHVQFFLQAPAQAVCCSLPVSGCLTTLGSVLLCVSITLRGSPCCTGHLVTTPFPLHPTCLNHAWLLPVLIVLSPSGGYVLPPSGCPPLGFSPLTAQEAIYLDIP